MFNFSLPELIIGLIILVIVGFGLGIGIRFANMLFSKTKNQKKE